MHFVRDRCKFTFSVFACLPDTLFYGFGAPFGALWDPLGLPLEPLGALLGRLGLRLELSWGCFWEPKARF